MGSLHSASSVGRQTLVTMVMIIVMCAFVCVHPVYCRCLTYTAPFLSSVSQILSRVAGTPHALPATARAFIFIVGKGQE